MSSPYLDHWYDVSNSEKAGKYDGYQGTVNFYRIIVDREYRNAVLNGRLARQALKEMVDG